MLAARNRRAHGINRFRGESSRSSSRSFSSLSVPVQKALQQARGGAERGLSQALESRRKIHPTARGRVVQYTQRAGDGEVATLRFPAPFPFVHKQQRFGPVLLRQDDGLTLALPQQTQAGVGWDLSLLALKPSRAAGDPLRHGRRSFRMLQFAQNSFGDHHTAIKPFQKFRFADEHQIIEGGSVGDNDHRLLNSRLVSVSRSRSSRV